ncbi:MAG: hypothetical protein AB7P31_01255 [Steroidobacteraceae bacterium]
MSIEAAKDVSRRLNQDCFCVTVEAAQLRAALTHQLGGEHSVEALLDARPHLFANTPVFLPATAIEEMLQTARAIEAVATLPAYQQAVLAWAPDIARHDPGPIGVFMGYDFHLTDDGPRLIEVNTNAGGAFLNAVLRQAQRACCVEEDLAAANPGALAFEPAVVAMFLEEWRLQGRAGRPQRIALVDTRPQEQYLYPEFLLAQRLLARHGFETVIAEAAALRHEGGRLLLAGEPVDLVYNRLVDFALERPEHAALRDAYLQGAVVLTPHPRAHALFADKRNLGLLSDGARLASWGLDTQVLDALRAIPRTVLVTADNAQALWGARKDYFFKPAGGHGGKAVYRGDKLTRGVWAQIVQGGYIAQEYAAPGERRIRLDGEPVVRKVDVRLYTYGGQLLLSAARLYQGQTTNFRTPGGGFAPLVGV